MSDNSVTGRKNKVRPLARGINPDARTYPEARPARRSWVRRALILLSVAIVATDISVSIYTDKIHQMLMLSTAWAGAVCIGAVLWYGRGSILAVFWPDE